MGMKRRRRLMFRSEGLGNAAYSLTAEEKTALDDAARDFDQFLTVVRSEEHTTYSIGEIEALQEKLANASEIIERLALTAWEDRRKLGAVQNSSDEDQPV